MMQFERQKNIKKEEERRRRGLAEIDSEKKLTDKKKKMFQLSKNVSEYCT